MFLNHCYFIRGRSFEIRPFIYCILNRTVLIITPILCKIWTTKKFLVKLWIINVFPRFQSLFCKNFQRCYWNCGCVVKFSIVFIPVAVGLKGKLNMCVRCILPLWPFYKLYLHTQYHAQHYLLYSQVCSFLTRTKV